MSYLGAAGALLLVVVVVVVSVFVSVFESVFDPLSQPVNTAPITSPISTIKVDIRFIGGIHLRKSNRLTREIFCQFSRQVRNADFQSAVSPICNRQRAKNRNDARVVSRLRNTIPRSNAERQGRNRIARSVWRVRPVLCRLRSGESCVLRDVRTVKLRRRLFIVAATAPPAYTLLAS